MTIKPYKHTVQYYETDRMGFVHHSNYIRWMEEARSDFFDQIGWPYVKTEEMGIISPVVALDCKYKQPLPFDFYLPQKNICIEFQGEQHYKERSLYYSEDIVIRDNIKKEYCKKNNIKLIIIPYTAIDNIPKFLDFHGKD